LEVTLEHSLAAMHNEDGMDVRARSRKPIGHLAERGRINELVVVADGDVPAIVTGGRRGEAFARAGGRRPAEWASAVPARTKVNLRRFMVRRRRKMRRP
jgi:hypothetical protein